jgi:SET domain-containing protein
MTDNLRDQLKVLLENNPELNGCSLSFLGADNFLINEDKNNVSENNQAKIIEKNSNSLSVEAISGNSSKIEIRKSPVHGYGVFAKEAIEVDELIDECRLLKFGYRANYNHDPVLKDYVWVNQENSIESEHHGNTIFIALGFSSMFNHSDHPNTSQSLNFNTEVMTVKAKRRISENEELFVNYGNKYFLVRNFWKGISKNQALEKFLEKQQK